MSRIRTIKPEFFRHELLQDLESSHKGKYPMLVFVGLWTQSDKQGVFPWKPRILKLDILPFINFDMETTLKILLESGLIRKFEADGKYYGFIPSFTSHQRITGKEATSAEKYPTPEKYCEAQENQKGSIRETPEQQQGAQERERERERIKGKERNICASNFAKFWEAYPKKQSKGDAEKAFNSINPDELLMGKILSAVLRAKTQDDWIKENGKYIPYPATWLRAKGWEDEGVERHPLTGIVSDNTMKSIDVLKAWSPPT